MDNLVRCKACGYIMKQNKLKDVCPACGVPAKAFEPYKDPLSEKRSRLLALHLHPILVHFPQAFASIIPFLLIAGWLLPVPFKSELLSTATVLIYLLPLTVIPAVFAGLIDGKVRFKKIFTQILLKKIFFGIMLFVISVVGVVLAFYAGVNENTIPWLLIISIVCIGCELGLGKLGESIMESKLPG
jgi:uncharacterized membrane protein